MTTKPTGISNLARPNEKLPCVIDGCKKKRRGYTPWCPGHLNKHRLYGHPLARRPALYEKRKRAKLGLKRHRDSVDVRLALGKCHALLTAYQTPLYPIGWRGRRRKTPRPKVHPFEERFRHLLLDGVTSFKLLWEMAALWQHFRDAREPLNKLDAKTRNDVIDCTLGTFVFQLGFCGHKPPRRLERIRCGQFIRRELGEFLEKFSLATEQRRKVWGSQAGKAWAPQGSKRTEPRKGTAQQRAAARRAREREQT